MQVDVSTPGAWLHLTELSDSLGAARLPELLFVVHS